MEIITKIINKIKTMSQLPAINSGVKTGGVLLLMIISFIFGKLSSVGGNTQPIEPMAVYLPNGSLLAKNTSTNQQNELSKYIIEGVTNSSGISGPSTAERLAMAENSPIYDENGRIVPSIINTETTSNTAIFGSKNGSTYYTPGCKSGNRVKPENRVYFSSETDAEDQGYTRSKLCK